MERSTGFHATEPMSMDGKNSSFTECVIIEAPLSQ